MAKKMNDITKLMALFLVFFTVFSCGSPSDQANDKKIDAEKKRISDLGIVSQTEYTYLWVDSLKQYSDERIKSSFIQYDHSGNVITEIRYDMIGNEHSINTFEYDSKGNIKSHTVYFKREMSYKVINELDEEGREMGYLYYTEIDTPILKNVKSYNGDILNKDVTWNVATKDTVRLVLYNNTGKIIEDLNFNKNLATKRIVYDWTSDERQVIIKELAADGTVQKETTKRFDEKGNECEIEEMIPYSTDTLRNYFLSDYDSQGNKIKEIWYRPANDTIYIKTWKYDDKNHLVERTMNEFDYFETNERNEVIIKEEGQSKSSTVTVYQFEYDKQGSLIHAFASKNGQPYMKATYDYSYR